VAIVEDDPVFFERFRMLVADAPELTLCGAARSFHDGHRMICNTPADVYMIDLGLPGGPGTDLIRLANARHPGCDVLVVTVFGDDDHVLGSIAAGANGYLLKDSSAGQLIDCIKLMRDGGSPITPSIARKLLNRFQRPSAAADGGPPEASPLTARQAEILRLLAKGARFADIAQTLGISAHTVTAHVRNIYQKLEVTSRGEAVFEARQRQLI
jgi:DNA-binding NarL/FixJ family response regulator